MTRLLIIADDFTGSLDTGVQLAKHGIDTLVAVMRNGKVDLSASSQVLVVNTESRHIPAAEAYARVAGVVKEAVAAGFTHFYKKTDSTLRGNIGAELAALLETIAPFANVDNCTGPGESKPDSISEELIFIPAFPKLERYTIGGLQYVGDTLLAETAFAADPFNPIRQSDVRGLIQEQTKLSVENIMLGEFESLRTSAAGAIRVVDARTDADLQAIGSILKQSGKLKLLAGCAGFAELLPELLDLPSAPVELRSKPGSTLLVSGSVNPRSVKQVSYALENCNYAESRLSVEQKIDSNFKDDAWEADLAESLLKTGRGVIWSQRSEKGDDEAQTRAQELGIEISHLGGIIAANIGAIVKRMLARTNIGTLIVFGGDTLLGIADALDCHLVRPVTEIVPGIALARFVHDSYSFNVVTKAGGFGGDDVVREIEQFMTKLAE